MNSTAELIWTSQPRIWTSRALTVFARPWYGKDHVWLQISNLSLGSPLLFAFPQLFDALHARRPMAIRSGNLHTFPELTESSSRRSHHAKLQVLHAIRAVVVVHPHSNDGLDGCSLGSSTVKRCLGDSKLRIPVLKESQRRRQ